MDRRNEILSIMSAVFGNKQWWCGVKGYKATEEKIKTMNLLYMMIIFLRTQSAKSWRWLNLAEWKNK